MLFIVVVIILLSSFLITIRKRQMGILKRQGIPGPKPNLIFGSALKIAKEGASRVFLKLTKQYGPIVGFYIGGRPQVLISDLNLIRQIMIKDFHIFSDRHFLIPGGVYPQLKNSIAWTEGKKWKNLRLRMTPSFSSSKLNAMESSVTSSIENMLRRVDVNAKCGKEFNMEPLTAELVFSISTKCFFGANLSLDHMTHEIECFLKMAQPKLEKSILAMAMVLFPSLTFIAYRLRAWWEIIRFRMLWSPDGVGYDFVRKILHVRKGAKTRSNDLMQSLMDFGRSETVNERDDTQSTNEPFSDEEICVNLNVLILAAFSATSVTLQFIIHNLVNNQDIQEKLRNELMKVKERNGGTLNSKMLSEVPLLTHVIMETLRMFPPGVTAMGRSALNDYEYQGCVIPKGTGVFVDIYSIHNDPQYWPEPNKFQPERFEKDYDKFTYLPFGVGLRNCIGMRFAYMEMELTLANLIVNYRFEPGASTEKNIEILETALAPHPKNGVFCKAIKVEHCAN